MLAQQLNDACHRQLLTMGQDISSTVDQVLLEEFIALTDTNLQHWTI